jgi:hypothetical protein
VLLVGSLRRTGTEAPTLSGIVVQVAGVSDRLVGREQTWELTCRRGAGVSARRDRGFRNLRSRALQERRTPALIAAEIGQWNLGRRGR